MREVRPRPHLESPAVVPGGEEKQEALLLGAAGEAATQSAETLAAAERAQEVAKQVAGIAAEAAQNAAEQAALGRIEDVAEIAPQVKERVAGHAKTKAEEQPFSVGPPRARRLECLQSDRVARCAPVAHFRRRHVGRSYSALAPECGLHRDLALLRPVHRPVLGLLMPSVPRRAQTLSDAQVSCAKNSQLHDPSLVACRFGP